MPKRDRGADAAGGVEKKKKKKKENEKPKEKKKEKDEEEEEEKTTRAARRAVEIENAKKLAAMDARFAAAAALLDDDDDDDDDVDPMLLEPDVDNYSGVSLSMEEDDDDDDDGGDGDDDDAARGGGGDDDDDDDDDDDEFGLRASADETTTTEKPTPVLSSKALAKSKRAQEKRGIVYLGSIPPRMKPQKLRQLLTPHGALDRIFLTPEDPAIRARRKQARSVVSFCHRAGPPLRDRVRVSVSFASHAVVNLTF